MMQTCDVVAAVREAHRMFVYGLFEHNPARRRFMLWQWLQAYECKEAPGLLRETWYVIVKELLWSRDEFVVGSTQCLVLGPLFPVRYEWLSAQERHFLVHDAFRFRKVLFTSVKVVPPAVVHLSGFCGDAERLPGSGVWRRALVRDLASWMTDGVVANEFACAVNRLAVERGDRFLCEVGAALNGWGPVTHVPCFGLGADDPVRPREEEEQHQQQTN